MTCVFQEVCQSCKLSNIKKEIMLDNLLEVGYYVFMVNKPTCVRFNDEEKAFMSRIVAENNTHGASSASEYLRLLLRREMNKSAGMEKPVGCEWQSDARRGRPKKEGKIQ